MPTHAELRARLDAALAAAEEAARDAAGCDAVPEELRARHAAVLNELIALRREMAAAFE
ncbi:MAG TPA: hypothetical protein VGK88_04630 [bacterium]